MAILNSRLILLSTVVLALAQLTTSLTTTNPSSPSTIFARAAKPGDPGCGFEGNADFYGIGVRVGFYLQWIAGLIAWVWNPAGCEELADAQTVFLAANLIAALVLSTNSARDTNVVVIILLFYMFFGGSVSAVTSASASLDEWGQARGTRKIAAIVRQVFVQITFLGMLIFSFWFWATGIYEFKRLQCGTYVFPVAERLSLNEPQGGSVVALLLLLLVYIFVWWISLRRQGKSFRAILPGPVVNVMNKIGEKVPVGALRLSELQWTIIGGILQLLVIIWCVSGLELTLKWNGVTGVNYLGTTGQLIPFIIGLSSLPVAIWGVVEKWDDKKHRAADGEVPEERNEKPSGSLGGENEKLKPSEGSSVDGKQGGDKRTSAAPSSQGQSPELVSPTTPDFEKAQKIDERV
jgi:hypothetical protein